MGRSSRGVVLAVLAVIVASCAVGCSRNDAREEFIQSVAGRLQTADGLAGLLEPEELRCIGTEIADQADSAGASYDEWLDVLDGNGRDEAAVNAAFDGFDRCAGFGELFARIALRAGATPEQASCIASQIDSDTSFGQLVADALLTTPGSDREAEDAALIESLMQDAITSCL